MSLSEVSDEVSGTCPLRTFPLLLRLFYIRQRNIFCIHYCIVTAKMFNTSSVCLMDRVILLIVEEMF